MKKAVDKNKGDNGKVRSDTFVIVLSLISIIGFIGIISETIFNYDLNGFIESAWIIILGLGLIIQTKFTRIKSIRNGLNNTNLPYLTNLMIGLVAILSGVFSLPTFKITNPAFHSLRGLLSLIAIVVIITETWVVKRENLAVK